MNESFEYGITQKLNTCVKPTSVLMGQPSGVRMSPVVLHGSGVEAEKAAMDGKPPLLS